MKTTVKYFGLVVRP